MSGKKGKARRSLPRGRRKITQEFYDSLLVAWREGGNATAVARIVPCHSRTATRAFRIGWPAQGFRPIGEILEEEAVAARALRAQADASSVADLARDRAAAAEIREAEAAARLAEARRRAKDIEAEAEARAQGLVGEAKRMADEVEATARKRVADLQERAHGDAVEQRAEEAIICRAARKNALALLGVTAKVLSDAGVLAEQLRTAMRSGQLTPGQAVEFLRKIAQIQKDGADVARSALELERLRVGDPTNVVAVKLEPASLEEAERDIEHARALLDLARRRAPDSGAIEVVEVTSGTNGKLPH